MKETENLLASKPILTAVTQGAAVHSIPLSNSDLMVIVDSDMYEYLSRWKWKLVRGYAKRSMKLSKRKGTTVTLHREIIAVNKNEKVIFKDSNSLNCVRENMMIGTQKNVKEHSRGRKENKTKFKGVRQIKNKYSSTIKDNGKAFHIGVFDTDIEAAKAYNDEAQKRFGQYAKLNDVDVLAVAT
jgi:hypothetical protein